MRRIIFKPQVNSWWSQLSTERITLTQTCSFIPTFIPLCFGCVPSCVNMVKSCLIGHWIFCQSRKVLSPSSSPRRGLIWVGLISSWSWAVLCCPGLGRRNRLWHGCSNGPFTGRISQADLHLGLCPETTFVRESHLTLHAGWKEPVLSLYSTHRHLPFLLLFLLLPSPPCHVLAPAGSFPPLVLCLFSSHTDYHQEAVSWGEKWPSTAGRVPPKSVVTDSYYIVYLCESGGRRTLTIFKSGATTSPH